jgi:hypothetical protein
MVKILLMREGKSRIKISEMKSLGTRLIDTHMQIQTRDELPHAESFHGS